MKLIKRYFVLFFLPALCISVPAAAQKVMSLQDAIQTGLKNNYDILMARNQEEAAALNYRYAFGAFLPDINGSASRTWSSTNVFQKYTNGNSVDKKNSPANNLSVSANLNWTLFDGLKVFATKKKLEEIKEAGSLSFKEQVITSVANIIAAYYDVVQQKEQLNSISQQMDISKERVQVASVQFNVGSGSKLALLQAEVDLNAQKAAYLQQQTAIEESKATLNQLIALPAGNDYDVEDTIPVNMSLDYHEVSQGVSLNNPALQLAQKNIAISQSALQEIQRSRFPTLSFISSYSYSKVNSGAGFFLLNQSNGPTYGFTASIPIFNGFNINRQAKSAQLNILYEQLSYENQRSQTDLSLQNAFRNYDYYKKAIELEEQNLGVAQENVKVALEAFKQGQSTTVDVKIAQQGLADALYRLISARYNAKLAETNLLKLEGNLVR